MYDRKLIEYIPHVIRNVREYKEIMNSKQPEMVSSWESIDNAFDDQFIVDATENGVERWEKILGIVPQATLTLDERKFTILARVNEQLPFTIRTLEEALKTLCGAEGYSVQLNANEYALDVKVALSAKNNFEDVKQLLKRVVPANIIVYVTLKYNAQDILTKYTHSKLAKYTHYDLRNEVLT